MLIGPEMDIDKEVAHSLYNNDFESFQNHLKSKNIITSDFISYVMSDYRFHQIRTAMPNKTVCDSLDKIGIKLSNNDNVSPIIKFVEAIIKLKNLKFDENHIFYMFVSCWYAWWENPTFYDQTFNDIKFMVNSFSVGLIPYCKAVLLLINPSEVIDLFIKDNTKQPFVITSKVINECLSLLDGLFQKKEKKYSVARQNMSNNIKHFLLNIEFDENIPDNPFEKNCPFFDNFKHGVESFMTLVNYFSFSQKLYQLWLEESIEHNDTIFTEMLIHYGSKNNLWANMEQEIKHNLIMHTIYCKLYKNMRFYKKCTPQTTNFIMNLCITFKINTIKWIDFKKKYGKRTSDSIVELLNTDMSQKSYAPLLNIIDFAEPIQIPIHEEWCWIGFGLPCRKIDSTYKRLSYDSLPQIEISDIFKNMKTISDIIKNMNFLTKTIRSPTSSYFDVDTTFSNEIFYRDQQDCAIWALDEKTGKVFLYDDDMPYEKIWVAKSLPEFLTRLKLESDIFYGFRQDEHINYIKHYDH